MAMNSRRAYKMPPRRRARFYQYHRRRKMNFRRLYSIAWHGFIAALLCMAFCQPELVSAQQITGTPGSPSATTTIQRQAAAAATAKVRGQDRAQRRPIDALLAGARRTTQGRAQYSLDHDRRYRLRRLQHIRRRDPDAERSTGSPPTACATPTSTRRRCARRRARR